jgi:AraC family transcriptional regulator
MGFSGIYEACNYGAGNRIGFSRFTQYDKRNCQSSTLAIKYVVDGLEQYKIGHTNYDVKTDKFLLINPQQAHDVYLEARKDVTGVCINIDLSIVNDVLHNLRLMPSQLLNEPAPPFSEDIVVYNQIYSTRDSSFGYLLQQLGKSFVNGQELNFNQGLYYQLAAELLNQQSLVKNTINRIRAEKLSTKNELYKRIEKGREMIEDNIFLPINITEVASVAAMSPFHFSRTFKAVYKMAPHQYIIKKRLEEAGRQLKVNHFSVAEIAVKTGFADIYSFSKSFKKAYHLSPRAYRIANNCHSQFAST